jgi:hypothetical protein
VSLDRLSPDKQEALKRLPLSFRTADLKKVRQDQGAGVSDGTIGEMLREYEACGLIRKVKKGQWQKLPCSDS